MNGVEDFERAVQEDRDPNQGKEVSRRAALRRGTPPPVVWGETTNYNAGDGLDQYSSTPGMGLGSSKYAAGPYPNLTAYLEKRAFLPPGATKAIGAGLKAVGRGAKAILKGPGKGKANLGPGRLPDAASLAHVALTTPGLKSLEKTSRWLKEANAKKVRANLAQGMSLEEAVMAAYPEATKEEKARYMQMFAVLPAWSVPAQADKTAELLQAARRCLGSRS